MLLNLVYDTLNLLNCLAEVNVRHDREQPFPGTPACTMRGTRHVNKSLAGHTTAMQAIPAQAV